MTRVLIVFLLLFSCQFPKSSSVRNCINQQEIDSTGIFIYFNDVQGAIDCAKKNNQPIFIVFTLWGKPNRTFTEKIVTNKTVKKYLTENFTTLILTCDDKSTNVETLNLQKISTKTANTIGDLYTKLGVELCQSNIQPIYTIIDSNGNKLTQCWGYSNKTGDFIERFKEVLQNFG